MGESANGLGEGCSEEIRTVNEFRVVTVPGDAVIVGSPLVLVGGVLGDNSDIADEGGGGEIGGRRRHITWGRGAEQARAPALAAPEVNALESEKGKF